MAQIFFGSGPSGLWHDALGRNRNLQSPGVLFLLTPFWLSCYDFQRVALLCRLHLHSATSIDGLTAIHDPENDLRVSSVRHACRRDSKCSHPDGERGRPASLGMQGDRCV